MRFLLLVLLLLSRPGLAQQSPIEVPDSFCQDPATLARYLTRSCPDPREKAQRIYSWIIHNISYDMHTRDTPDDERTDETSADRVLQRRQGICCGYAALFLAMAEAVNLDAKVLVGDCKDGRHEWNAVRLKGKWYLLDPTYGAGFARKDKYYRCPTDYYFCTEPSAFLPTHFPDDPDFQLVRPQISRELWVTLKEPKDSIVYGPATMVPLLAIGVESHEWSRPRELYGFRYRGASLVAPTPGSLKVGTHTFHVVAPGALEVVVAADGRSARLLPVAGSPGEFRGDMFVRPGLVRVSARFGSNLRYEPLLEYDVREKMAGE